MKQPDWAERKARKLVGQWSWDKDLLEQIMKAIASKLRIERRRAVRVCKRVKAKGQASQLKHDIKLGIGIACDDCAAAIIGKP